MIEFLKKNVWIYPLLFALLLGGFGWSSMRALEHTMQEQVRSQVETTLETALAALDIWVKENQAVARLYASDARVVSAIEALAARARESGESIEGIRGAPEQRELNEVMGAVVKAHGFTGWGSQVRSGFMIANMDEAALGQRPRASMDLLPALFAGEEIFTPPILWDGMGDPASAVVSILFGAPVRNSQGQVIATLGFGLNPEEDFSQLLNVARPGTSGETYAFNADAVLVSRSRFEEELREIGLLPDDENITSALAIHIRAPGGNMAEGYVPERVLRARPLTKMAADAIAGNAGVDIVGYPDYRGVPVVGAWHWLPGMQVGVATELDLAEAYAGLYAVRARLTALVVLLGIGALGMFLYSFVVMRLQSQVDEAKQLGRYSILRKLGQGGMGTVYLAKHALLRRPTAIKVLDGERANEEGVARFEREVQVSSSLSHPNTIEIYDYGYTPDGTFYYAMELLRGITLSTCVDNDGAQCDERVVYIMRQICASLAEAHKANLIHRDLKPANIMLCERGGLLDFVKVLDFGLVREERQSEDVALTSVNALTGTPLYMSPEAVESPDTMDARSDVYQLGAIAYYLMTGNHLFEGESAVDVLSKHIHEAPTPPSERLGRPVDARLEDLILRCLAKSAEDRPVDAVEMYETLETIVIDRPWGQAEARLWWAAFLSSHPNAMDTEGGSTTGTIPTAWEVDLQRRSGVGPRPAPDQAG